MNIDVNWPGSSDWAGINSNQVTGSRHVQLKTAELTAAGLPNDGTIKYATLVQVINPADISGGSAQSTGPNNSTTSSSLTAVSVASGQVAFIQNLSTNPLYVLYGLGCTTSKFNLILPGGTVANDGNGGNVSIQNYVGPITIAGTSPSYVSWAW